MLVCVCVCTCCCCMGLHTRVHVCGCRCRRRRDLATDGGGGCDDDDQEEEGVACEFRTRKWNQPYEGAAFVLLRGFSRCCCCHNYSKPSSRTAWPCYCRNWSRFVFARNVHRTTCTHSQGVDGWIMDMRGESVVGCGGPPPRTCS